MDRTNNTYRLFVAYNPNLEEEIIDQIYMGDHETLFLLENGSKVLFDDMTKYTKMIFHSSGKTELTDDEWVTEFSRKLRRKISMKRMSQKDFSEMLNISSVTMSRYINGKRIPDMLTIRRMASVLECSVDDLTNFDYLL